MYQFLVFYGISHVIRCAEGKMQRKIAERCIRYSTKVGLSPASTTTLPLLDTKIGCGGRTRTYDLRVMSKCAQCILAIFA